MFILLNTITWMVAARVVNIVKYMPVAVATLDSIPIIIRAGLKIMPGPRPLKAAKMAPVKEMIIMFGEVMT